MKKEFVITEENVSEYAPRIGQWIKSKVEEANRKGVVLGMSGGIDSAVVARLCQIGDVDCYLVIMPFNDTMSDDGSMDNAMALIEKFNFKYHVFNISGAWNSLFDLPLYDCNDEELIKLNKANLKARIRMCYLYQQAQLKHRFVIGTSNLSERYTGYCTKWGDMACDLNPIGNLLKSEVYVLAKYFDIPDSIINKPPSAGFWPGQTDEEEMGFTYNDLDNYILYGKVASFKSFDIAKRHKLAQHKLNPIPMFDESREDRVNLWKNSLSLRADEAYI